MENIFESFSEYAQRINEGILKESISKKDLASYTDAVIVLLNKEMEKDEVDAKMKDSKFKDAIKAAFEKDINPEDFIK